MLFLLYRWYDSQKPGALHNLSEFVSGTHRFGCQEYLTAVAVGKEEKDPPVREHFIEGPLAAVGGRESLGFCPVLGIPPPAWRC